MIQMVGVLMPVTWDFAFDIAAEVGKYVPENHGTISYRVNRHAKLTHLGGL